MADASARYGLPVQFRVLGPLEVDAGDGPIPLGGPKQRAVLASLLVRANEVVPADTLIEEVWGDDPPDKARNTLQTYVSNLRRSLGNGRLRGRSPGYILVVDPPELDAARFNALVREAKRAMSTDPAEAVATLEAALALWRGPALADLADQRALLAEATRLDELRLEAEADRIEGLLASGAPAKAVGELEALVVRHPLRERLWGLLMLALYREGRQAEALGAFQRAREILTDELGIDPSTELVRLQQRILEHDPTLELRGEPLRGYRLLEPLGEGSFGIVHRAIQPHVGREVAIKSIYPPLANDPAFVRRFEAEAQLVARLEHPHVVPLYDYWRDPDGAFLVMRYLPGGSLRRRLETSGPIAPPELARILEQLCRALATAHRQGIVHRDVKPENVLLDEDANAYLSDFGIAQDLADPRATRTGMLGTPEYLAPEQILGARLSPQTDVHGLGVLLFEALTGEHPFAGGSIAARLERILHEPLPSLRGWTELPPAVNDVVARATAKEPALRFPDVMSLAAAFDAALDLGAVPVDTADAPNPFKGLRAFSEADAADFFGREALVERLVARLAEPGDRARFLGVVGPSGSGKSSAVRAGLIPALRRGALPSSGAWFVVEMAPGEHPLDELEAALRRVAVAEPDDLPERLRDEDRGLSAALEAMLPADGSRLVLVVDQLEETFTLVRDEAERRRFLALLASAVEDPRAIVVATLRADLYDRPLSYPGFGELLAGRTEAVPALTPDELEQAIRGPAEQVGVRPEPGLVAEIVADVAYQPGALPLVQYALTELFERRANGRLTSSAYREIGGIGGALSARAEGLHAEADASGRHAIRQVFLRLVTLGEGREDTRRLVTRTELDALEVDRAVIDGVLGAFGDHRLLTFDREPASRQPTVEIAHEALLGAWDRLRGWIDEAREDLRLERRLEHSAADWEASERDPSFLLRGARLERAETWAAATDVAIGRHQLAYLKASADRRDAERAEERARFERERRLERRSVRRLRGLVAVFAVAALVAASLTIVATDQRERATREARIANAREIAAAAIASIDEDPERAVMLAIEAVRATRDIDGTVLPEAQDALHRTIAAARVVSTLPILGAAVAWGPGDTVALERADAPGTIELRDAQTGELVRSIPGHEGDITGLEYGPDGRVLASTGEDGALRTWLAETGAPLATVTGRRAAMGVSFGAGGALLAAAWPAEGLVRVVDPETGREVSTVGLETFDTSLSPWGERIALATSVPTPEGVTVVGVAVVDLATGGQPIGPFIPSSTNATRYGISSVAWSPDGRSIASIGLGGLDLWDAASGDLRAYRISGFGQDLAWSADGAWLIGGGPVARLWRVAGLDLEQVEALTPSGSSPELAAAGVGISPDGSRVIASSATGTVTTWDVATQGDAEWVHLDALPYFSTVDFLAGGELLAIGPDGATTVWDVATRRSIRTIGDPHLAEVGFHPSPDGGAITLGTAEGIAIYDLATGARELVLPDGCGYLWSPDGTKLLEDGGSPVHVCGRDGTPLMTLTNPEGVYAFTARFSADGRFVLGELEGVDAGIAVWDLETSGLVRTLDTGTGRDWIPLEPDGRWLLVGGTRPRLWDVRSPDPRRWSPAAGLEGHPPVCDAAFSPDGSVLATGGSDGVVRLFDPATGEQFLALRGHDLPVCSVAFSADGSMLASQSPGEVRVWALDVDDLLAIAEANVTRSLTHDECRRYLHLASCPAG